MQMLSQKSEYAFSQVQHMSLDAPSEIAYTKNSRLSRGNAMKWHVGGLLSCVLLVYSCERLSSAPFDRSPEELNFPALDLSGSETAAPPLAAEGDPSPLTDLLGGDRAPDPGAPQVDFSANYSDPFGVITTGEGSLMAGGLVPLYGRFQLGPNYRELLVRAGIGLLDDQMVMVFTGRGLQTRQELDFGGSLASPWLREHAYGFDIAGKFFGMNVGAYSGVIQSATKDLGDVLIVQDTAESYIKYRQPRRVAGVKQVSAGLRLDSVISPTLKGGLALGGVQTSTDYSTGRKRTSSFSGDVQLDWLPFRGGRLLSTLGGDKDTILFRSRLLFPLASSFNGFAQCMTQYFQRSRDSTFACGVGVQYLFGNSGIPEFFSEEGSHFSIGELMSEVRRPPSYIYPVVLGGVPDGSAERTVELEIIKSGLGPGAEIDVVTGDLVVAPPPGQSCGALRDFSTVSGASLSFPMDVIEASSSGGREVIRFHSDRILKIMNGFGSLSSTEIRAMFEFCSIRIVASSGIFRISEISYSQNPVDHNPVVNAPRAINVTSTSFTIVNGISDSDGLRNVQYFVYEMTGPAPIARLRTAISSHKRAMLVSSNPNFNNLQPGVVYQIQTKAEVLNRSTGQYSLVESPLGSAKTLVATAPVLAPVPDQRGVVGTAFTLNLASFVTATNGDPVTGYTLGGTLPAGLSFNSSTGVLSGTPSAAATASLTLSARDKDGVSNSDSFVLTIAAALVPPVVGNVPDQSGVAGTAFTLNLASFVTATNGDPVTGYTLGGTLPAGVSFNSSTGVLSGTPSGAATASLTLSARDKDGVSNSDSFVLTIAAAPVPPVVGNVPDQSGVAGTAFTLNLASFVTATNGDPVTGYTLGGTLSRRG
ncbi:Ig domain-containing protein [Chitinilyticum piscinae]|uniref:Putative Ig domain-containing protein n=1 Tax=Chitinilyticum piscinae TaxID=2866724 RepID=A0A8J7K138_9NEIS|nr:Ig domain-containing protein [Chitinilyticum piscinae]MBE9608077.1 putative Ig domain-containing protein [Chitinilyticum piscinae]